MDHAHRNAARSAIFAVVLLTPAIASAADPDATAAADSTRAPVGRSWTYLDDPRVAAQLQAVAIARATYTDSGTSPTRPFASNTGVPGGTFELGGELGVVSHVSIAASGILGEGDAGDGAGRVGALAGVRVSLFPDSWTRSHLTLAGGYLRELTGGNGTWLRVVGTQDFNRVRLGASIHGEHVFEAGRDDVDVMVNLGASVRVVDVLRLGVEYVGQDLEETFDDEAEGGARHFIGPTAALSIVGDRLSLVGGPALGLSSNSPRFVGRFGVAYSF